ncbi:uncharacterized protein PHACADRAFT_163000 [Phanerochaete carnosa HHB-10118-sp]|uniref:Cytochrome P450 n=1 Tax=Phanerochaete carnosa (strain HHB-10118-sp) TaxID=650164 RepID=K5W5Z2_PHACS|nr:uncharacterized protein PHACADRAFT_163000 [Phanerochaete carnosa HHB-10118-sp]EKM54590.1 hypothetical protein PHACADRAFT_163000 [Phanerochaete carnosa HHB-10118-sp]
MLSSLWEELHLFVAFSALVLAADPDASTQVCHLIFKKWEPTYVPAVALLLLLLPLSLSALLIPHYGPLLAPLFALATYHTVLLTSISLYRILPWHPLYNYPGPFLARLSKWWIVWKGRNGRQHFYMQELHNLYGDIVRIGPNEVSIRDVGAVEPLMGTQGLPRGPSAGGQALEPPVSGLIIIRDPVEHARRRRPWARAFSTAALKEYEPVVVKRATQLCEQLAVQKGSIDLAMWLSLFSYDVMGDIVFGGGSDLIVNGDSDGVWSMLQSASGGQMAYYHAPWLAHYAKRLPMAPMIKKLRDFATDRAAFRYKNGAKTKDLFYYLSNEDEAEKTSPDMGQVISEGMLATVAASDTTATVLGNTFWNILRYPHYYKRLQAEVDKYYPAGENAFDTKNHSKMVFLDAVLNEALRLYPVIPSGSQRAPIPGKGDRLVGPYLIPDGTQARVHFWSLQRDPRYFSQPETYWPERWLIAEGLERAPEGELFAHDANAFIPFSFGPENCVGKNLAQMEMRMVCCYLVQNLEFELEKGWDPAGRERAVEDQFVMRVRDPVPVVVRRRT